MGKGRSPMLVVCLDDACGTDDDELRGLTHNNDAPGGEQKLQVCPRSPQRGPRPSRKTLLTRIPELRKGRGWWYEFKEDVGIWLSSFSFAIKRWLLLRGFLLVTTLRAVFTSQVCDSHNVADSYMTCNGGIRQVCWNSADNGTNSRSESVVSKEREKWHLKNHIM